MASTEDGGIFPDSISTNRLRDLLKKDKPVAPKSEVIPALCFRDEDIDSGGLCDLQLVIILLVNQSKGGLEFIQLLTASLYLFEVCFDTLGDSIEQAEADYENDDKDHVIGELKRLQSAYKEILSSFTAMHLGLSATASIERVRNLMAMRGGQMDQGDAESTLLVSDALINSLGIDRDAVSKFLKANQ